MNILLIFFALPLATIILAAVLQKLIKCPILVAAIFFAIYLIVAFAAFDATFLIAVIVYTFLAYVTAAIVRILCWFFRNCNIRCGCNDREDECSCRRGCNATTNNVLALSDANEAFTLSNGNGCTCRVTCRNNNASNPDLVTATNNIATATNNIATAINNNFGCQCRRRCR